MDTMILPADTYQVINKSIITEEDKKILNMLYLPIIGPLPVMLYNMFLTDLDKSQSVSSINSHAHMLANLRISANEYVEARNSLEAIGLLKTYLKTGSVNNYLYELYSPISAYDFFSHPMFNMVLYNNVGKIEYEKLTDYFKKPRINKNDYKDVTHSFSQVFKSIPSTSFAMAADSIRKYNKLKLNIDSDFDINFLIETMPMGIDKKIFTKDLQELIVSLAYLYDLDAPRMQNIIKSCINERGTINRDELRKVTRTHYQFDHNGILPTVIEHTQPECYCKPIGDNSKLAKMIYTFETVTPYDFLKSKHNGAEPVKRDMQLLEDLIVDYKLKPGVVNVLVDYVLKTNDNKLSRKLVETIAGQWSRKNVETVEEAMDVARKNHKAVTKTTMKKKQAVVEKEVPVWLDQETKAETATAEEQQAIEDMLKEYR